MVHGLIRFDRRAYGEHTARCGKILSQMEKYSLKLGEVTCPTCRIAWINSLIEGIDNKISMFEKIGVEEAKIGELREQRNVYVEKLKIKS